MIVADIKGELFVLASMQDAEMLLGLMARAVPVRRKYCNKDQDYALAYTRETGAAEVSVTITTAPLVDTSGNPATYPGEGSSPTARAAAQCGG